MTAARTVTAALVSGLAVALLAGCTHAPDDAELKAACEAEVGPAIVDEWRSSYGDVPQDVTDVHSTSIKAGPESDDEVSVFYISGTASVQPDERNAITEPMRWSCFSQYRNDDQKVSAAIRSVSFR